VVNRRNLDNLTRGVDLAAAEQRFLDGLAARLAERLELLRRRGGLVQPLVLDDLVRGGVSLRRTLLKRCSGSASMAATSSASGRPPSRFFRLPASVVRPASSACFAISPPSSSAEYAIGTSTCSAGRSTSPFCTVAIFSSPAGSSAVTILVSRPMTAFQISGLSLNFGSSRVPVIGRSMSMTPFLSLSSATASLSGITLVAATLGWVHVPGPPVEAMIALSIVFVAAEIVHGLQGRPGLTARAPWVVAFVFGLLHGFGFAGALAEVGLPEKAIPVALLMFNVGVELGQLIFVAAALAIGILLARLPLLRRRWMDYAVPYAIGSIAMFWVIERVGAFA